MPFTANAGHAPPHTVDRGSSSPTPRQVSGCGFETAWPQLLNRVPRGPRLLRPVENRPTAHGARVRWRTWCDLSSRPMRGAHHSMPLADAVVHRHRDRPAAAASDRRNASVPLPYRAARARFAPWRSDRPPTGHARAGGPEVFFAVNPGRTPPHAIGRGSFPSTPRQVGGCGLGATSPQRSNPMPRGPRALRPVDNRPTAHGARAHWRTWHGCLRGQHGARSTQRR